jgi:hypothetical protein
MNREREKEVQAVTVLVCVTILVLAVMGMLASAYEWTWVIAVLKLCAWMAIGMMLFVCGWHMGAMWQHEHGGRKCGARSVDEEDGAVGAAMDAVRAVDAHELFAGTQKSKCALTAQPGLEREEDPFMITCLICGKRAKTALGGELCADCVKSINEEEKRHDDRG